MREPRARGPIHQRRPAQEWARTVDEWRRSGMKTSAFCSARGLARKTFVWWRWALLSGRLGAATVQVTTDQSPSAPLASAAPSQRGPAFVEVMPRPPRTTREVAREELAGVEVVLRHDRRVRVERGFDSATLRRVVAILEEV